MSPAKNGNKVKLQASLHPETWQRYSAEAARLGIDVSALLELIARTLPLDVRRAPSKSTRPA